MIADKPQTSVSPIASLVEKAQEALLSEIAAVKQDPSRTFVVVDGHLIYSSNEGYLYDFRAEALLPFQADTAISILMDGNEVSKGTIVSIADFEITVQTDSDIGDPVQRAEISAEPWFILEACRKRLAEGLEMDEKEIEPLRILLGIKGIETQPEHQIAQKTSEALAHPKLGSILPNESQLEALGKCLTNKIHFVWGPPGTGKTANLAQLVRGTRLVGEKTLLLGYTNASVDVAMKRVAEAFEGDEELLDGKILRIGTPSVDEVRRIDLINPEKVLGRKQPDLIGRKDILEKKLRSIHSLLRSHSREDEKSKDVKEAKHIRQQLKEVRKEIASAIRELVVKANVVGATLSRLILDDAIWNWEPDAVLIDEASIANFPFVLGAGFIARKRIVCFGDFRQLPPISIARSNDKTLMVRDIFEIAGIKDRIDEGLPDDRVTMLRTQYRMGRAISEIVSGLAYGGRLVTEEKSANRAAELALSAPFEGASVVCLDSACFAPVCFKEPKSGSYSRVNPIHGLVVLHLVKSLQRGGLNDIAVITPYRAQARLISDLFDSMDSQARPRIATVHRFQGSESDAVIVDFVDSYFERGASMLTGRDPELARRLANVALSRARGKLIILCNRQFIDRYHPSYSPVRKILSLVERFGSFQQYREELLSKEMEHLICYDGYAKMKGDLVEFAQRANARIVANIPDNFPIDDELIAVIRRFPVPEESITLFCSAAFANHLEDTRIDLRLMIRQTGFFFLIDKDRLFLGGSEPDGLMSLVKGTQFVRGLDRVLLGNALNSPQPDLTVQQKLQDLFGRCDICREYRKPKTLKTGSWVIGCDQLEHQELPLDMDVMNGLASILALKCSRCGSAAIIKKSKQGYYFVCSKKETCSGRPPMLEEIFGG